MHAMLGNDSAARGPASQAHRGPECLTAILSGPLSGSHVLGLRRRLSVCGLARASPRGIERDHSNPSVTSRPKIAVVGDFDDIGSDHIRFLEEAAALGALTVLVFSDE